MNKESLLIPHKTTQHLFVLYELRFHCILAMLAAAWHPRGKVTRTWPLPWPRVSVHERLCGTANQRRRFKHPEPALLICFAPALRAVQDFELQPKYCWVRPSPSPSVASSFRQTRSNHRNYCCPGCFRMPYAVCHIQYAVFSIPYSVFHIQYSYPLFLLFLLLRYGDNVQLTTPGKSIGITILVAAWLFFMTWASKFLRLISVSVHSCVLIPYSLVLIPSTHKSKCSFMCLHAVNTTTNRQKADPGNGTRLLVLCTSGSGLGGTLTSIFF